MVTGFADNLVGLTAIEYEKNLTSTPIFSVGYDQVRDYMAGLLNTGVPQSSIRGVLSDTVRWFAYEIDSVAPTAVPGHISKTDLTLCPARTLPHVDCSTANIAAARQMYQFLEQHLGRDGGQVLSAQPLYEMLGVTSAEGASFVRQAEAVVDAAFVANPAYATMVQDLWANFVSFVGTTTTPRAFDKQAYIFELYLLTLAKLIAANVIQGASLINTKPDLLAILDGSHFEAQGLTNLVEYDYFGWLTNPSLADPLVELAEGIQVSLRAFDFAYLKPEDLFGRLVAQLAETTQRLLLGQEPTPGWLVKQVVDAVERRMPPNEPWRFIDPCCGSGAFIAEVIARRLGVPGFDVMSREARGQALCETITGFDIDPLAVVFAKVTWLIAAKSALLPFNSGYPTSIPIYHADSLFAITPLARSVVTTAAGDFELDLDGRILLMPEFLADPTRQAFFDEYAEALYSIARLFAQAPAAPIPIADIRASLIAAETATGSTLSLIEAAQAELFGTQFSEALAGLERLGRNGLWLHMLKNGYRPAMVRGRFNAVLTNFPWLALSRLTANPYKAALQARTTAYNLQPLPQSAPHLELATIFMLHAAKHYLGASGFLAAVVPNSVIQGAQHQPLRSGLFRMVPSNIPLYFTEVWDVDKSAFGATNVAAVLVGQKGTTPGMLTGSHASEIGQVSYPLYLSTLNDRNAWTKAPVAAARAAHYRFEQGADIMPRTTWLHDVSLAAGPGGSRIATIAPISSAASQFHHLIANANRCRGFRALPCSVSERWAFNLLTSSLVVQFFANEPALAILPFERRSGTARDIRQTTSSALALDRPAAAHFSRVFHALQASDGWNLSVVDSTLAFDKLNLRGKITKQKFQPGTTLIVYGAGGTYPCAARFDVTASNADTLILDQTLYWLIINDPDEADFVVGMLNSVAIANVIRPFQPVGINGPRHVHTLPLQVLPAWVAADSRHQAVVRTTRALVADFSALVASTPQLQNIVATPTANIAHRRRELRAAIAALPSFTAYDAACALVV